MTLPEKIVALHTALRAANLPHAFGGALALAWCTQRARGTIDIDINIFVDSEQVNAVFAALPGSIDSSKALQQTLKKDGQVRLWWDKTPVDIFLNTTDYHREAQRRIRWEAFAGNRVPFLDCLDVAVFKTFFNRTRDWADLEAMQEAGTLDTAAIIAVLERYLGNSDERIDKLRGL